MKLLALAFRAGTGLVKFHQYDWLCFSDCHSFHTWSLYTKVEDDEPRLGGHDFVLVDKLSPGQMCPDYILAMRNRHRTTPLATI